MTKHIAIRKNMTRNCGQDAEEEAAASEGEMKTVRKLIGEVPDAQSVWDVTGTVTEESRVEEIPLNIREQVPWHPSTERHEMTGESNNHTVKVRQREVVEQPPPDHKSDQEESEDEEMLSEVN